MSSITDVFSLAQIELNKTAELIKEYNKLANTRINRATTMRVLKELAFEHLRNYWTLTSKGQNMLQKGRDNLILPSKL